MNHISKKIFLFWILAFAFILFCPGKTDAQLVQTVLALTGNVFNEVTNEPVTVFLIVMDENDKRVNQTRSNSAENGKYYITGLKPGKKYFITVKQKNYFSEKFEIILPNTDKYEEISRDFLVKPLEKNIGIKIKVSPFELNKSKLRYGAELVLDDITNTLLNNPDVKFEISCFPDNNENRSENLKLTDERAKSLMAYFISKKIDPARITAVGHEDTDKKNPPPTRKSAKGKRYIGPSYIVVTQF